MEKSIKHFEIGGISENLLNLIPDMILVKGEFSHILWANKAFQEYYGMTNDALKGLIDSPVSHPDHTQQYIKDDEYVYTTGETLEIPAEPVTRHDGEIRFFNTIKTAVKNDTGEVFLTIGISRDVTERRKIEEEMKMAMESQKKLNAFMVDRELKMVELKKEIDALKSQTTV